MPDSSTLVDRVKIFVESSGTGPFQLGNALPSFRGSEALTDGLTYSYAVESGSDYEVGQGVYVLAVDQLIRSPTLSSNGGAPVSFPANAAINFTALAADLVAGLAGSGTVTSIQGSGGTTGLTLTGGPITGAGTLTLGGVLGVANGGTAGATEAEARTGIGLGNVDNTSDADKPVSDATLAALDGKVDRADLSVTFRAIGADPTGVTSCASLLVAALATYDRIEGTPGDTYLIGTQVLVPAGKDLIGNGATLKFASGIIGLRPTLGGCLISGWTIQGESALYAVLSEGNNNSFTNNNCTGNIGHFFFGLNCEGMTVTGNRVLGLTADTEITTAFVAETCKNILITDNQFNNIPVGWGVQIRSNSEDFTVANNSFLQTMYTDEITATGGQTVFNFTLGSVCLLKKVQINGLPLSSAGNYTITGSGPAYTVTFGSGRTGGDEVKLVGYRGAENIQINSGSKQGVISGNNVNGTGDSGIIVHGSAVSVTANSVRNAGYAGIAVYGDQDEVSVTGNQITDCSQLDDGLSNPDDPMVNSVFAGGLLLSGNNATATGNVFTNDSGTMRYGIRINKTNMTLRTDGTATISLAANVFKGTYVDGKIFAPNDATGERVNSISVDSPVFPYPAQIDMDQAWTLAPPGVTGYLSVSGFNSYTLRDTTIKQGGEATIKTQPNSYIDYSLDAAGLLFNCNVIITFWAKNDSGSSYVEVYTDLGGGLTALTATITDTAWKQYTISFPLTANLEPTILIRIGGTTGFANVQNFKIMGQRL